MDEQENINIGDISKSELSNIILNIILVNADVRPAFLLQPSNLKEATGKDKKTAFILSKLRDNFPELKYTEDYEIYQGIIISKKDYSGRGGHGRGQIISLNEMGRILGYPCYRDFEDLDRTKLTYVYDVIVVFTNGEKEQLIVNIGKDREKLKEFKDFAKSAEYVLKNCDFKDIYNTVFGGAEEKQVSSVYVELYTLIPIEHIIDKIITKRADEPLSKIYENEILNYFYNMNFSMNFQEFYKYNMQYDNMIHNGILLGLLLNKKNDTVSAFSPIQRFPIEEQRLYRITEQWEKDLMQLFTITKKR